MSTTLCVCVVCGASACVCGRGAAREREGGEAEERGGVAEGEEVGADEEADSEREVVDTAALLCLLPLPLQGVQTFTQTHQPPPVLRLSRLFAGALPHHEATAVWGIEAAALSIGLGAFVVCFLLPLCVIFILWSFFFIWKWT